MNTRLLLFTVLTFVGFSVCASAGTYTFNFNGLTDTNNGSNNDAAIATYMDGILGCSDCVTVTGAVVDEAYTADGNVVGPSGVADTLGNTDGATNNQVTPSATKDTFLANTDDGGTQISQEISIAIAGMSITSASFDYEIFPDISCQSLGYANCGGSKYNPSTSLSNNPNLPDFQFATGTGNTPVSAFGTGGTQYGVVPGNGDGNEKTSPLSNNELAPQYIGVSGSLSLAGVSQLDFIDWPATIGIDNLVITTPNTSVPEPTSVLLLATACLGVVLSLRRRFKELS